MIGTRFRHQTLDTKQPAGPHYHLASLLFQTAPTPQDKELELALLQRKAAADAERHKSVAAELREELAAVRAAAEEAQREADARTAELLKVSHFDLLRLIRNRSPAVMHVRLCVSHPVATVMPNIALWLSQRGPSCRRFEDWDGCG